MLFKILKCCEFVMIKIAFIALLILYFFKNSQLSVSLTVLLKLLVSNEAI